MTKAEVLALGVSRTELNYRVRQGRIVFDVGTCERKRASSRSFATKLIMAGPTGTVVNYVSPKQTKVRPCLCCRHPFESEGPGNRMCAECRARDVSPFAPG